jgi:hypothetical protein
VRLPLLVLLPVLLVGVAGTVFTLAHRESDPAFVFDQENPRTLEASQVERAIATAPEPVEAPRRTRERSTACEAQGTGDLQNPWWCRVAYRSGRSFRFYVVVAPDGRFTGRLRRGGRIVFDGCCVAVPRPRG